MLCNGVEGGEDSERTMLPEYGMKMLFKNCHPRYGRKGYIYVLIVFVIMTRYLRETTQKKIELVS